jgi:hypothetical protein
MSRLRTGARATLARWRGIALSLLPVAGAAALAGGAALRGAPVALALLAGAGALSALMLRDSLSRLRLHRAGGPGVVEVAEGRVAYFGPAHGGVADLDTLRSIEIAGGDWVLRSPESPTLRIPLAAEGATALLDAFAALPGFSPARAAEAAGSPAHALVWRRPAGRAAPTAPLASPRPRPYISGPRDPEDGR